MKKKLIAVAVAGALAAPAVAVAQSSTVQIYGVFNVEYGVYVDNGDRPNGASRNKTDQFNSGASRIGFKGEEKLGGGLSAWFQCETSIEFLAGPNTSNTLSGSVDPESEPPAGSWCDRNSALGLKGGWGNLYLGTWDSPAKQVTSATRMLNETGWFGAQRLLMTSTPGEPLGARNYSARNWNSVNYASPKFGGLTINGQVTTRNPARNSLSTDSAAEWRHWGLNGIYSSGPLVVGAGWTKIENQFGTVDGRDDQVFVAGVNYKFGAFKLGGVWTRLDLERGTALAPDDIERDNYNVALEWDLSGPGMVRFGVTHAGKTEVTGACSSCGSATQYQVSYNHSFSKRTVGTIGYVVLDNGSGGHYNLQAHATGPGATGIREGEKSSAVALGLAHSF